MSRRRLSVVVVGAGPAGLTAAYLLAKAGQDVTVLEADRYYVGGISRTVAFGDFKVDIGGHRFFTKAPRVQALWDELLPNDFLERPRSSRIYYRGRFFSYPLKAGEALRRLGVLESLLCLGSYLSAKLRRGRAARTFEDWVSNRFGPRLYRTFFKTYTEKVWGMKCSEISADWAEQRIQSLSLLEALKDAVSRRRGERASSAHKTLITSFRYPRQGPGMMWEEAARRIAALGGQIRMGCSATGFERLADSGRWRVAYATAQGQGETIECDQVICSAAISEVIPRLSPAADAESIEAARALRYRDFITVAAVVRDEGLFKDNWIYIHDPGVRVGRIQNFKSWSPEMVPFADLNCLGLEYFCFEGDALWNNPDSALVELARAELLKLGLLESESDFIEGHVVRQRRAYPVYDAEYRINVASVRECLQRRYPGFHLVGRNGMHQYNNQDHSMMTAMLTVDNVLAREPMYDAWNVNQNAEYIESGIRRVPSPLAAAKPGPS